MITKEEWDRLFDRLMPMISIGIGGIGIALTIMALRRNGSSGRRVYYQDGQTLVSVRYGQWHDLRDFVQPSNSDVLAILSQCGHDYWALFDWVCSEIQYRADPIEFFQFPSETIARGFGDCEDTSLLLCSLLRNFTDARVALGNYQGYGHCFPGETRIVCLEEGRYCTKMIGEINQCTNLQALSYNFDRQQFEFKPVVAVKEKGIQATVRVRLTNGTSFTCTPDHFFYATNEQFSLPQYRQKYRTNRPIFEVKPISNIRRSKYRLGNILTAKEIPALNLLSVPSAQLAIEGIYAAEGCCSNRGVRTKAKDFPLRSRGLNNSDSRIRITNTNPIVIAKITSNLNNLGASYAVHWRDDKRSNRKVVCTVEIFAPEIKDKLTSMGKGSQDMAFLSDRINASKEQIETLVENYHLGDGHTIRSRQGFITSRRGFTTASGNLAKQLRFLHLILGRRLYSEYRKPKENHSGNWRLYESSDPRLNTEILPKLVRLGIRDITESGFNEVYDIEIADNHNFVLADSFALAHNCWVVNSGGQILETTYTRARIVPDPQDYCPYCMFNESEVSELWPGALDEVFELNRDEGTKLNLLATALGAI